MLDMADYGLIKAYRRQGKSKRWIAKELGISRNTVRRYLREEVKLEYQRNSIPSKLDPYKDYILAKLSADPYTAARLYREVKEQGYPGS